MKNRTLKSLAAGIVACTVLLMSGTGPAYAHHSGAMFDRNQVVVLDGVVKAFQWTNPHSWLQVEVSDGKGGVKEWSVECGSPNTLARSGWRKTSFNPGDKVKVRIGPMIDGTAAGLFMGAQLANGATLGEMK
jgi:hypothetical protein